MNHALAHYLYCRMLRDMVNMRYIEAFYIANADWLDTLEVTELTYRHALLNLSSELYASTWMEVMS